MNSKANSNINNRYILFRLGEETYGTPIMKVREVTEYKEPKPIPNSMNGFNGVINLRGEVLGVIDLRKILNITSTSCLSFLVFENSGSMLAGMVDRVMSVIDIPEVNIEKSTSKNSTTKDYYLGIAKLETGLVTLIDLEKIGADLNS